MGTGARNRPCSQSTTISAIPPAPQRTKTAPFAKTPLPAISAMVVPITTAHQSDIRNVLAFFLFIWESRAQTTPRHHLASRLFITRQNFPLDNSPFLCYSILRVAAAGSFLVAAFDVLGGKEPNMLGSKREYGSSSQHIVMIAINGDFSWDRSAISLGMFGAKSFRSWDHWDKSFFLDRQPAPRHAGAGGTGHRHRNTDHTAEDVCHTGMAGSRLPGQSPPYQSKKWGHMGISPGDEWGRMGMNGTPPGGSWIAVIARDRRHRRHRGGKCRGESPI